MTREEICQRLGWMTLPKQSEMLGQTQHVDLLDRIETIVGAAVAAEREACARMFDGEVWSYDYREIAAKIRARGQE